MVIIGSGGSGKSTFSRKLSEKIEVEVYHLDAILWKPNWQLTSREEQIKIQTKLIQKEQWIIDGNYGATMDIRLKAADTIIYLDMPRILCLYRVLKRRIQYHNKTRPDMREGCAEKMDMEFLKWVWNYPNTKRPSLLETLNELKKEKQVIHLKSPKEVRVFLHDVKKERRIEESHIK
ncbi:MAG: DNA topology modulation protein [Bacillaceae bacterium]